MPLPTPQVLKNKQNDKQKLDTDTSYSDNAFLGF
jgi:hypothetical protein